jgi:hypothetical protein
MLPPESVTLTTIPELLPVLVGVPLISPEEARLRPPGNDPEEISHLE